MEYLDLPAHRIPFELLDGVLLRDWTGRSVRSFHSIFFLFFGVFCSWAWMTVKVRAGYRFCLPTGGKIQILRYRISRMASSRSPLSSRTSMRCSPFTEVTSISSATV